jgi:hypothetical protein
MLVIFSAQNITPTIQNSLSSYFARQAQQFTDKIFQRISDQTSIITSDAEADFAVELKNILTAAIDSYRSPTMTSHNEQGFANNSRSSFGPPKADIYRAPAKMSHDEQGIANNYRSSSGPPKVVSSSGVLNANLTPLGPRKEPKNTSALFTSRRGLSYFLPVFSIRARKSIFLENEILISY